MYKTPPLSTTPAGSSSSLEKSMPSTQSSSKTTSSKRTKKIRVLEIPLDKLKRGGVVRVKLRHTQTQKIDLDLTVDPNDYVSRRSAEVALARFNLELRFV